MKAAALFIKALENEGIEYIFGIPGEENLELLDALSRSSIELILTRHELAAGFMAATYGRLTGKAGVCLSPLGPGATNLVTAAAHAQLGGMPISRAHRSSCHNWSTATTRRAYTSSMFPLTIRTTTEF